MRDRHADLVAALRSLGDSLDAATSPRGDPVSAAVARIAAEPRPLWPVARPTRRRRPAMLVAAALVAAVALVVAVPDARAAVARLLGIGPVRIVTTDEPVADVAGPYDLGEPIPVDEAIERAPGPLAPDGLPAPAGAFSGRPTGAVTVVWPASGELPPIVPGEAQGAGLVITVLPDPIAEPLVTKVAGAGTLVEPVTVAGLPGYWIAGAPHVVETDADPGGTGVQAVRLAGNTLLWADGDVTYRLESGLSRDAAIALAEQIPSAAPTG